MKNRITIKTNNIVMLTGMIVLFLSMATFGAEDYTLLIQSSPPDGGTVTPGIGVHSIGIDRTVALSAKPKPGYRFMYWLGDVSSTNAVDTLVSVNSPKLVVAVFSKDGFDNGLPDSEIVDGQRGAGGGGGGRYYNPIQSPGSVSPGINYGDYEFPAYEYPDIVYPPLIPPLYPPNDDPPNEDIPVPGDDDDIPVPGDGEVPEPATILILGLGATVFLKRRR